MADYESLSINQLRAQLATRNPRPKTRDAIIAALQALDEEENDEDDSTEESDGEDDGEDAGEGGTPVDKRGLFGKLPPELRDQIWDLTLIHNRTKGQQAYPSILATCKTIHKECTVSFYERSKFTANLIFTPLIRQPFPNNPNNGDGAWLNASALARSRGIFNYFAASFGVVRPYEHEMPDGTMAYMEDAVEPTLLASGDTKVQINHIYSPFQVADVFGHGTGVWPATIGRIRDIDIWIDMNCTLDGGSAFVNGVSDEVLEYSYSAVNFALYALVVALNKAQKDARGYRNQVRTRTMTVNVVNFRAVDGVRLRDAFCPLIKLDREISLRLQAGYFNAQLPQDLIDYLVDDIEEEENKLEAPRFAPYDALSDLKWMMKWLRRFLTTAARENRWRPGRVAPNLLEVDAKWGPYWRMLDAVINARLEQSTLPPTKSSELRYGPYSDAVPDSEEGENGGTSSSGSETADPLASDDTMSLASSDTMDWYYDVENTFDVDPSSYVDDPGVLETGEPLDQNFDRDEDGSVYSRMSDEKISPVFSASTATPTFHSPGYEREPYDDEDTDQEYDAFVASSDESSNAEPLDSSEEEELERPTIKRRRIDRSQAVVADHIVWCAMRIYRKVVELVLEGKFCQTPTATRSPNMFTMDTEQQIMRYVRLVRRIKKFAALPETRGARIRQAKEFWTECIDCLSEHEDDDEDFRRIDSKLQRATRDLRYLKETRLAYG